LLEWIGFAQKRDSLEKWRVRGRLMFPFVNLQIMNGMRKEREKVLLEERNPIWVELRDLFIADVRNFGSSNSLQCFGFGGA